MTTAVAHVTLSAAVMTHPRRRSAALDLRRRHPDLDLAVVEDPEPDGPPNALRAARLAWQAVRDDASHHLVVQDDMQLTDDIADLARQAAAALPGRILCLFTEWGSRTSHALRLAVLEGASWAPVLDPYVPTAALLLPADLARALAARAADAPAVPDDVFLLDYVRAHGLEPYVSVPNLAEHAPAGSLVGNDVILGPRRSALFAGRVDGVRLDGHVSRPAVVPHLLLLEGYSVCHVRSPAGGWAAVRTHEYLAGAGLTLPWLLDRFTAALGTADNRGRLRAVVAEPMLLQIWLTAFAYGVTAAVNPGDLDRPAVVEALRTFAPGATRRFVPGHLLESLPDLCRPLIAEAIRAGHHTTPN